MNKEEYFKNSDAKKLPKRCPILNYCARRAWSLYLLSESSKVDRVGNMSDYLISQGVLPNDFEEKKVPYQGEAPEGVFGNNYMSFNNVCPEVNLFKDEHAPICAKGVASASGEWII